MDKYINMFLDDIHKAQHICIASHVNPDGDAVGSSVGLAYALEAIGKKPHILLEKYSERYNFMGGGAFMTEGSTDGAGNGIECDMLVCLDCASLERLGLAGELLSRTEITYNIDHHVSNTGYAAHNYVENASSTCELLYRLVKAMGTVNKDVAAALYAGILTDSGCFRHGSTTPQTLETAARLMETGIDAPMIQRLAMYEHSFVEARIFAQAVNGMVMMPEIKFALACLTAEQMRSIGAKGTDLDGIAEYLLNTRGAETSALLSEREPGIVNISMRSTRIDVNKIAAIFGGGGHRNAAGAKLTGEIEAAAVAVTEAVRQVYEP